MRRLRAVSDMIAALILIAIVAFAGIMLFLMVSGFFTGGVARASLTVSATGMGSPDGSSATLNMVLQNTGDGPAGLLGIYVEPAIQQGAGVASVSAVSCAISGLQTCISGAPPSIPSTTSVASPVTVAAKSTQTILVKLSGSGLYPGAQLRVYVAYYNINSKQTGVASALVTLQ